MLNPPISRCSSSGFRKSVEYASIIVGCAKTHPWSGPRITSDTNEPLRASSDRVTPPSEPPRRSINSDACLSSLIGLGSQPRCRRAAILSVQESSDFVSPAVSVGGCRGAGLASRHAVGPDVAADGVAGDPEQPGGRPHRESL